jgi:hypothetical protein
MVLVDSNFDWPIKKGIAECAFANDAVVHLRVPLKVLFASARSAQ